MSNVCNSLIELTPCSIAEAVFHRVPMIGMPLGFDQPDNLGRNSIDIFLGPEPAPSYVVETCLNLLCHSAEFGPEHGPVLCPKFKMSIE